MTPAHHERAPARPPRPWWIGAVLFLVGAVWLHGASTIASTTHFIGVGPAVMVRLVGGGLAVVGILLIIQALRGVPFSPQEEEGTDALAPPSRSAFWLALAGVACPLLTMRHLGFAITAMLAFTLVTHAFGSRRTTLDLGIGSVIGCLCWYGFTSLGVALGPFFPLLH